MGLTSGHKYRGNNHQLLVFASEDGQQGEYYTGTHQNGKPNWDTANSYANGIMSVNVESLRRPKHDDGEEVGSRDEGNDQS